MVLCNKGKIWITLFWFRKKYTLVRRHANTFDQVTNSFLFLILENLGFCKAFIRWIKSYKISPWILPLVIRHPSNFFISLRGFRQGCPLSPLLYIIMAERMSRNLEKLRQEGKLVGLGISENIKGLITHNSLMKFSFL